MLGELLADNTLEKRVFIYEGNRLKPGSALYGTRSVLVLVYSILNFRYWMTIKDTIVYRANLNIVMKLIIYH